MENAKVQARLTLLQYLWRESLSGVTQALALAKAAPLAAAEKERLFGEVERAVWALPDALFDAPPVRPEEWAERLADEDVVRAALESGLERVLRDRTGAPETTS